MARLNRYKLAHLHQLIVERKGNAATIARAVGCAPSTVTRHALLLGVALPRMQVQSRQGAIMARYYRLKAEGLCVSCAKVAPAKGVKCRKCRLGKVQHRRNVVASRYYRLKEAGTCVSCAKVPAIDGQVRCTDCAAYQRASLRNTRCSSD